MACSLASALLTCLVASSGLSGTHSEETRTYLMGFAANPPKLSLESILQNIETWSKRADIAAVHEDVPWKRLLSGESADSILQKEKVELVKYYRGKGLKLYFMVDLTDGLDRSKESKELRALNRSLVESEVQRAARTYITAVDRMLKPDYLGIGAETNLFRKMGDPKVYRALVDTANGAAKDLKSQNTKAKLVSSIQCDIAWGWLGKTGYEGIAQDLKDFDFADVVGISSYPYFVYEDPSKIPADYFSKIQADAKKPVMVVEGGWASGSSARVKSSDAAQAAYVDRLFALSDSAKAIAIVQLLFADLDFTAWPEEFRTGLAEFGTIGIVKSDFSAKPGLAKWDAAFARKLTR